MNGDGKLDVVTANLEQHDFGPAGERRWHVPARQWCSEATCFPMTLRLAISMAMGNLTWQQLALQGTGYVYVLLGNGDGTFQDPQRLHVGSIGTGWNCFCGFQPRRHP